jgi:hypothetical protein
MRFVNVIGLIFLFTVISCAPSRHAIPVEKRSPSKSGVDLAGKVISVVYSSTGSKTSDIFGSTMAKSFAEALENDYGTGKGSVGVYSVDAAKADYALRDSMVSILMQTGADLVFLFDRLNITEGQSGALPLKVTLYCYDGMDKDDKVQAFTGSTIVEAWTEKEMQSEAEKAGKDVASPFASQWKMEQFSIAYYDSMKWYEALMRAEQYDWKGAMDIWLEMLDVKDVMKRAALEYNIAVSCYLMGNLELAEQWLDRSDADNKMPTLSDALRKRITAGKP